jgi:2-C-methyl-D-erythritol 4-phosphate cytidylyltransferase
LPNPNAKLRELSENTQRIMDQIIMIKNKNKKNCAIIVAAGKGTRMNAERNKQFLDIAGVPVLARTILAFENTDAVDEIVLVVNSDDIPCCKRDIIDKYGFRKIKTIAGGGKERQDSVYNGLLQLDESCGIVLIHDGARPFIDKKSILKCIKAASEYGAACLAVPVKDTVKIADGDGHVKGTPDRSSLWQAQTPQSFKYEIITEAYQKAMADGIMATDDSSLVEMIGVKAKIVPGSYYNIKITTQEDLVLAQAIAETL